MTRQDLMEAADRLEEAKAERFASSDPAQREDLLGEIQDLQHSLFIGGYERPEE